MWLLVSVAGGRILGCCDILEVRLFGFCKGVPGARLCQMLGLHQGIPQSNIFFSSKALFMMSVMRWHCWTVECAFLNPNWWDGIQSWKCNVGGKVGVVSTSTCLTGILNILCSKSNTFALYFVTGSINVFHKQCKCMQPRLIEPDDRSRKSSERCGWIVGVTISSTYGACRNTYIWLRGWWYADGWTKEGADGCDFQERRIAGPNKERQWVVAQVG